MNPLTRPKSVYEPPCSLDPVFVRYKMASQSLLQALSHFFLISVLCVDMHTSLMYFSAHFTALCSYAYFSAVC
jgi:hypothetical protein